MDLLDAGIWLLIWASLRELRLILEVIERMLGR
jgi:hypothetical protein